MDKFWKTIEALRVDQSVYSGIRFIMWPIILGVILSFFIAYYRRRILGSLVRAIREANAVDEESAKTLAELQQENNATAIAALKKRSLSRIVHRVPSDSDEIDANTRLYIPEDAATLARVQFGEEAEPIYPILIGSVALIALGLLAFIFLPR